MKAPIETLPSQGARLVTGWTDKQRHHMDSSAMLDQVQDTLFDVVKEHGWDLQAWAVFSNHYHIVMIPAGDGKNLSSLLRDFHDRSTAFLNEMDQTPRRDVWGDVAEERVAFMTAYYARLKYVHENPVFHRAVENAEDYRWCSAAWFAEKASAELADRVARSNANDLELADDFKVIRVTPKPVQT